MNKEFMKNSKNNLARLIKDNFWLIFIILLFLAFRIPALSQEVYGDEFYYYHYAQSEIKYEKEIGDYSYVYFIPTIFYKLGYFLIHNIVGVRLISLIFGFLNLLLGLKITKKYFGKKAGIIFGIIYSVMPWAVFSSILLDNDATFISFMILLMVYCVGFIFEQKKEQKLILFLLGIIAGILFFIKFITTIHIFIISVILINLYNYILIDKNKLSNNKNKKKSNCSKYQRSNLIILIGFILGVIFSFTIFSLVFGTNISKDMFVHYMNQSGGSSRGINFNFFAQFLLPLLFFSPLFMFLPLAAFNKFKEKYHLEIYLWVITIISSLELIAIVYLNNFATLNRYATIILAPSIILISVYISKKIETKQLKNILIFSIIFANILFAIHLFNHRLIDFYPKINWLNNVLNLNWNFLFPINASNGPIGFYISFISLSISFVLTTISLILFKIYEINKKKLFTLFIVLSLIFSLGYCVYVSTQFSYNFVGPNINTINKILRDEAKKEDSYYVFRNNAGFFAQNEQNNYLNITPLDFGDENNEKKINNMIGSWKKVFIVDFPQINKKSYLWSNLNDRCFLENEIKTNGFKIGYIFYCSRE